MSRSRRMMADGRSGTFDCCDDITGAGGESRGGRKSRQKSRQKSRKLKYL